MIEAEIKQALQKMQEAVQNGDGAQIAASLGEVERLTAAHRGELNPQLVHFLQRRSYEKALAFLGGDSEIPAGSCGGGS